MFKLFKKKKGIRFEKHYSKRRTARFKNPFKIKKGIFRYKMFRIINIILFICLIGCLYFFIFSDYYQITNVEVSGNQIISTQDILDIADEYLAAKKMYVLDNNNIFILSKKKLSNKISEKIIFDDIKISKLLPNTLKLRFVEKKAALKWQINNNDYLIDDQGQIIKRYYQINTPSIFLIAEQNNTQNKQNNDDFTRVFNQSNQKINLGDHVLKSQDIEFILNLEDKISQLDYLNNHQVIVPNNFPEYLIIKVNDKWQIFFNFNDTVDIQVERLNTIIDQKITRNNLNRLDYIDLRLGESIYFKYKD